MTSGPCHGARAAALLASLAAHVLLWSAGEAAYAAPPPPAVTTLNASQPGLRYDGVGGLSANGAARLLAEYPEVTRDQLLDLMFLPSGGAAWQLLKVEIGGDEESSCKSTALQAQPLARGDAPWCKTRLSVHVVRQRWTRCEARSARRALHALTGIPKMVPPRPSPMPGTEPSGPLNVDGTGG